MASASKDATQELLVYGGLAFAAYLLLKNLGSSLFSPGSAANSVLTSAANTYVGLTSGPGIVAAGGVNLPNGATVPVSQINPTVQADGSTGFSYGGASYTVLPGTDASGNWTAVAN